MSSWSISAPVLACPAAPPVLELRELEEEESAECVLVGGEWGAQVAGGAERGLLLITPIASIRRSGCLAHDGSS